jgi:hypothetical protein
MTRWNALGKISFFDILPIHPKSPSQYITIDVYIKKYMLPTILKGRLAH